MSGLVLLSDKIEPNQSIRSPSFGNQTNPYYHLNQIKPVKQIRFVRFGFR